MPVKVFFQLDQVLLLCSFLEAGSLFLLLKHMNFIPNMHLNFVTILLYELIQMYYNLLHKNVLECQNPLTQSSTLDLYNISTVLFIIYIQQFLYT